MLNVLAGMTSRHPLTAFFTLTCVFSWSLWLLFQPLYRQGDVLAAAGLMLGIFGPAAAGLAISAITDPGARQGPRTAALAGFILIWLAGTVLFIADQTVQEGRAWSPRLAAAAALAALWPALVLAAGFRAGPGIRRQLAGLVKPAGARWHYLLAILLFPGIWGLGALLTSTLGMETPDRLLPAAGPGLAVAVLRDFFYSLCFTGLSEEPGWRGFALPRLLARFSPLSSSLILGIFWAVWHAPARFGGFEAKTPEDTIIEWIFIVLISIIFTWLYNRTKFSLLATVLLHPAMNTASRYLPLTGAAILLLAGFLVFAVIQGRMWRRPVPGRPGAATAGKA